MSQSETFYAPNLDMEHLASILTAYYEAHDHKIQSWVKSSTDRLIQCRVDQLARKLLGGVTLFNVALQWKNPHLTVEATIIEVAGQRVEERGALHKTMYPELPGLLRATFKFIETYVSQTLDPNGRSVAGRHAWNMGNGSGNVGQSKNFPASKLDMDDLVSFLTAYYLSQDLKVQFLAESSTDRLIQCRNDNILHKFYGQDATLNVVLQCKDRNLRVEVNSDRWKILGPLDKLNRFTMNSLASSNTWLQFDLPQQTLKLIKHYISQTLPATPDPNSSSAASRSAWSMKEPEQNSPEVLSPDDLDPGDY